MSESTWDGESTWYGTDVSIKKWRREAGPGDARLSIERLHVTSRILLINFRVARDVLVTERYRGIRNWGERSESLSSGKTLLLLLPVACGPQYIYICAYIYLSIYIYI